MLLNQFYLQGRTTPKTGWKKKISASPCLYFYFFHSRIDFRLQKPVRAEILQNSNFLLFMPSLLQVFYKDTSEQTLHKAVWCSRFCHVSVCQFVVTLWTVKSWLRMELQYTIPPHYCCYHPLTKHLTNNCSWYWFIFLSEIFPRGGIYVGGIRVSSIQRIFLATFQILVEGVSSQWPTASSRGQPKPDGASCGRAASQRALLSSAIWWQNFPYQAALLRRIPPPYYESKLATIAIQHETTLVACNNGQVLPPQKCHGDCFNHFCFVVPLISTGKGVQKLWNSKTWLWLYLAVIAQTADSHHAVRRVVWVAAVRWRQSQCFWFRATFTHALSTVVFFFPFFL